MSLRVRWQREFATAVPSGPKTGLIEELGACGTTVETVHVWVAWPYVARDWHGDRGRACAWTLRWVVPAPVRSVHGTRVRLRLRAPRGVRHAVGVAWPVRRNGPHCLLLYGTGYRTAVSRCTVQYGITPHDVTAKGKAETMAEREQARKLG